MTVDVSRIRAFTPVVSESEAVAVSRIRAFTPITTAVPVVAVSRIRMFTPLFPVEESSVPRRRMPCFVN